MARYRIVQNKPEGLPNAFAVEELIVSKAYNKVNSKYHFNQTYWESTFRFNAGARPADWFEVVPESSRWSLVAGNLFSNLKDAEKAIDSLRSFDNLVEEAKTFKPKVIAEYD